MPKLCKDCQHYKRSAIGSEFNYCLSPEANANEASYLANGHGAYADTMRRHGPCGMSGKFFEPLEPKEEPVIEEKPSLFKRLFGRFCG